MKRRPAIGRKIGAAPLFLVLAAVALPSLPGLRGGVEPDPAVLALIEGITADSLLDRVDTLVAFGTRRYDQPGGREAQDYIAACFSSFGLEEVSIQSLEGASGNVIGVLRGSRDPGRLHVIGAHYDSAGGAGPAGPAPGADDNASGTAAVLEAARAIAGSGLRPAETILFAAFTAEEVGLLGSKAYVASLAGKDETVADMICLDVIGYHHPGTRLDLSVTSVAFTPEIEALIAKLGEVASAYLPAWSFEGGPGCG